MDTLQKIKIPEGGGKKVDVRPGSEILRGSAEFRGFSRILGQDFRILGFQWKSEEKLEKSMVGGGGLSQELLGPEKWFIYQNLQN